MKRSIRKRLENRKRRIERRLARGGVLFQFGDDASPNLKNLAENLPGADWEELVWPPKYPARLVCSGRNQKTGMFLKLAHRAQMIDRS